MRPLLLAVALAVPLAVASCNLGRPELRVGVTTKFGAATADTASPAYERPQTENCVRWGSGCPSGR